MATSQNVRARLAQHRTDPACSGCHTIFDPIGLGLENYDGVGLYRKAYPNGDVIDATGTLPGGASFRTLKELAGLLAADPRFTACALDKLATYALGRAKAVTDEPWLASVRASWAGDGLGLRSAIRQIALSVPFRQRRDQPQP